MNLELEKLLNQFINGRDKYVNNTIFRSCVDSILHGGNQLLIIEELCNLIQKQSNDFEEYVKNDRRPFKIVK